MFTLQYESITVLIIHACRLELKTWFYFFAVGPCLRWFCPVFCFFKATNVVMAAGVFENTI